MNYTIDYSNGDYAILGNGDRLEFAPTYDAAEATIASLNEAHASWAMGGDELLIEARRFAERGREAPCEICDDSGDYCEYCNPRPSLNTPLLAQCAAVVDACLGGPVIGGGIIDELRRVRAALKESGW